MISSESEDALGPVALCRDRGNPQRSDTTCRFRDVHTPSRRRTIRHGMEVVLKFGAQPLHGVLLLHESQGEPIHPSRTPVPADPLPRLPQNVTSVDPVKQGVETAPLLLLGRSP